jgi:hypothetical protein
MVAPRPGTGVQTAPAAFLVRRRPLARWLAAALALAELAGALALQAQPADSPTATANALAIAFLAIVAVTLLRGAGFQPAGGRGVRPARGPALFIGVWLVLGLLRAIPLFTGRPGWLLNQSISAAGQTVTSQTLLRGVSFQPGAAPAHVVNTKAFNFHLPAEPDRAHLPLAVEAAAYVRGSGRLTVASSAPVTVRLGSRVLFDSSPPPGAPPGTVLTPNGPKSLDGIRRELQQAGYNGPTDDASLAFAYIRTTLSGGWQVDVDAPAAERLVVDVQPQDLGAASLQLRLSGLTPFAGPPPGGFGQVIAAIGWPLDLASLALGILSSLWLAWRFVARRSGGWRLKLGLGSAIALLYGAPRLADWAAGAGRLMVLSGGDDWLTYEDYARDIRGGSWLMLLGQPLGHAAPIGFQALYPYWLALGHFAFGEPVQALTLLQLAGAAALIVLAALTLPDSPWAAVGLLLVAAGGIVAEWYGLATYLLSENLFLLLLAGLLLTVAYADAKPTSRQLFLVGIWLGLAVLARTTAWLAVPFVLALICRVPGRPIDWRRLAVPAIPFVLLAALIPARNWIAAGYPKPFPAAGVNVVQGFVPPGRQITAEPWLTWARTHDRDWVASAEALVDAPRDVAAFMLRKAIYVLGFPRALGATDVPPIFFPVFLTWVLALPSLLSARHSRLAWVALALALTHAFSLVLIYPNNYYYRLVLPGMLPLAIWDALGIMQLLQGLPQPSWLGRQFARRALAGRMRGLSPTP